MIKRTIVKSFMRSPKGKRVTIMRVIERGRQVDWYPARVIVAARPSVIEGGKDEREKN